MRWNHVPRYEKAKDLQTHKFNVLEQPALRLAHQVKMTLGNIQSNARDDLGLSFVL